MKKAFLTMTGCLIATVALFSQTDTTYYSGFKFGFTYPVSTHGLQHTHQYSNAVSVNLLVGVSGDERAFAFSGLANIVRNNITGFQFAGLYNHAGNNGNGFAMSGLGNNIGNNYNGFLFAGLLNRSREMCGVQMTGLVNMAGNVRGIQFAGLVNMAANVSGVQIAGLVNVAKNVKGIQFAGLVNVADSSDYPIAIINIIKNGEKSIALSYNETGSVIVSFRSGGKVTYGIIGLGYNHKAGNQSWLVESGLGAHINCSPRFRINNELTVENFIMSKNAAFKAGYRLSAAYRFFSHMEIFAGTGISYMQTNDDSHTGIFPRHALWKHHNGFKFRQVSIGYQFGVQYIF
ncbi:MAG: hypothetical protein LBF81_04400 [Prevotellaceae bacterium]|nr:hypothetical protein [Prevotellaceae bacterium]